MNHDVTAQRLTSAHLLIVLFWTEKCCNAKIIMH